MSESLSQPSSLNNNGFNKIKVIVRVRPFIEEELKHEEQAINSGLRVKEQSNEIEVLFPQDKSKQSKSYRFDKVLKNTTTQQQVFEEANIDYMVKQVVDGYHSTLFAYGQTGSGKTYTMEGYKYYQNEKGIYVPKIDESQDNLGLVQRSVQLMLNEIEKARETRKVSMYVSFLEIYNEKIYDLLNGSMFKTKNKKNIFGGPVVDPQGLKLKWNQFDVYTVENQFTFECNTYDQVISLFHYGIKNKVIGSHKMNLTSSRSHSIFMITLEQIDPQNPENVILSKLQLVDLAGSERQSFTSVQGKTQKESIEINKSLFALRQVISALNDLASGKKEGVYVPYRDSKLTCLLRQSIGGNSYCCMIACLHPSDKYLEENLSTLTYASKAAMIANTPIRNDDPKTKQIEELKQQVKLLTNELVRANQHIQFLSSLTGQKPEIFGDGLIKGNPSNISSQGSITIHNNYNSNVVAYIGNQKQGGTQSQLPLIKNKVDPNQTLQDIDESPIILDASKAKKTLNKRLNQQNNNLINQQNFQQSLSIAKDVFSETAKLQEKINYQGYQIQNYKRELYQMQLESEDLRQRLQYLETLTGKDSTLIRDNISEETSKVDWAQVLLDDNTDDMIITVSREKIAHEIIRLRQDKVKLEKQLSQGGAFKQSDTVSTVSLGQKKHSQGPSVYSTSNTKLSLLGHKSNTPLRQRPNGGKLQPMSHRNGPVKALSNQSSNIDRNQSPKKGMMSEDILNRTYDSQPNQREDSMYNDNKSTITDEFIRTNEYFNQFTQPKVQLPNPHVTLRRKNTKEPTEPPSGSNLRRSQSGLTSQSNNDPMAQTLQKWRQSIQGADSIQEEQEAEEELYTM